MHRAADGQLGAPPNGVTTPDFTITDTTSPVSHRPAEAAAARPRRLCSTSLGADAISGVKQNATNAFGSTSGANVNALLDAILGFVRGAVATDVGRSPRLGGRHVCYDHGPAGPPPPFANLNVGDVLTIDDGAPASLANQENVTITAVNRITNTITFSVKNAHPAGTLNLTSAQTSPLQQHYAGIVARMGAGYGGRHTGTTSQTSLASNVNSVRQSTDGINIDEETQNLVKFQNAYGAAAHVISILSSMLTDAINLGGGTF